MAAGPNIGGLIICIVIPTAWVPEFHEADLTSNPHCQIKFFYFSWNYQYTILVNQRRWVNWSKNLGEPNISFPFLFGISPFSFIRIAQILTDTFYMQFRIISFFVSFIEFVVTTPLGVVRNKTKIAAIKFLLKDLFWRKIWFLYWLLKSVLFWLKLDS